MHQLRIWYSNKNGLFDIYPDHNFRKLKMPLLALHVSDDWLTPPFAVMALLKHFPNAEIIRRLLTPRAFGVRKLGHSGCFLKKQQDGVWKEILQWLTI